MRDPCFHRRVQEELEVGSQHLHLSVLPLLVGVLVLEESAIVVGRLHAITRFVEVFWQSY